MEGTKGKVIILKLFSWECLPGTSHCTYDPEHGAPCSLQQKDHGTSATSARSEARTEQATTGQQHTNDHGAIDNNIPCKKIYAYVILLQKKNNMNKLQYWISNLKGNSSPPAQSLPKQNAEKKPLDTTKPIFSSARKTHNHTHEHARTYLDKLIGLLRFQSLRPIAKIRASLSQTAAFGLEARQRCPQSVNLSRLASHIRLELSPVDARRDTRGGGDGQG